MLILGIDTSGPSGSIALVRCGAGQSITVDLVALEGGTFSAQLVPHIAATLDKHDLTKRQIEAFAVVSGPGSFTGLRIGLAAVKALGEILDKPITAVSLLEASAIAAGRDGRSIAVLDAGRGEVYAGTYQVEGSRAACVDEKLLTIPELVIEAARQHVVTPDQKLAEVLILSGMEVQSVPMPKADAIARIGFDKLQRGETVPPEALDATYIRRTDAEMKLAERAR
jgi:tRNA threonylcarbamoyladenosine biosynthesis protein TsaB